MAEHRTAAWRWWDDYGDGITSADDHRLDQVPSVAGRTCRLHWAAAASLRALCAEWLAEYPASPGLLASSGWRARKPWQATRALYEAELLRRYRPRMAADASDAEVIRHGRVFLAYRSPHFTGLAVDLGSPPPMRASSIPQHVAAMRGSNVYGWLAEHAPEHGWRWYVPEPWHLELPLLADAWAAPGPESLDGAPATP